MQGQTGVVPALGAITCVCGVCCPDLGDDHGVIHCTLQVADAVGSERTGIRLSPGATLIRTDEPRPWLGPDCVMRRSEFDEMQNGLKELKV